MPQFVKDKPRIRDRKKKKRKDPEQVKERIDDKVRKFREFMVSGTYHALGGCDIPVINDGGDCPPC